MTENTQYPNLRVISEDPSWAQVYMRDLRNIIRLVDCYVDPSERPAMQEALRTIKLYDTFRGMVDDD